MADSTTQQVLDVRAGLSHALGVATTALHDAQEAREKAVARLRRVIAAATARREKVAEARDERLREIDERHRSDLAAYVEAATDAANRAAPGAAGDEWTDWQGAPAARGAA